MAVLNFKFLLAYMSDLHIYPFSMAIYFPNLAKNDNKGRTLLYAKIFPRGDISSIRSELSSLELLSVRLQNYFNQCN